MPQGLKPDYPGQARETQAEALGYLEAKGNDYLPSSRRLSNFCLRCEGKIRANAKRQMRGSFFAQDDDKEEEWDGYTEGAGYVCNKTRSSS